MTDREMARDRAAAQTPDGDTIEEGQNPVMSGVRDEAELEPGARVGGQGQIDDDDGLSEPLVNARPIGPSGGVVGTSGVFGGQTPPPSPASDEPDVEELRRRID